MFRRIAGAMGIVGIICQLLIGTQRAHAEPAIQWNYKGSVVAFSQSGSTVIIAYQTLSDALIKSGAHVGDPLFRGQRNGNALTGKVYRFFGPQCQPMGFGVQGSIEGDTIILRGIAPALGLNSCKVETTYYDSLVLTAVVAPKETQQAVLPSEPRGFPAMKAAAPVPSAATSPVYLAFPFHCVIRNGGIVLEPTTKPYYHERSITAPRHLSISAPRTSASRRARESNSPACDWSAKAEWQAHPLSRSRDRRSRSGWCVATARHSWCRSTRAPTHRKGPTTCFKHPRVSAFCRNRLTSYPPTILRACTTYRRRSRSREVSSSHSPNARYIFAGYHYFFVSHPAREAIKSGLRSGELFDLEKLAQALREKPQDPEKVSLTETLARTANTEALQEQVQADAELADALRRRDRARAMQAEAEAELRRMRAKLPWWKRMFGA